MMEKLALIVSAVAMAVSAGVLVVYAGNKDAAPARPAPAEEAVKKTADSKKQHETGAEEVEVGDWMRALQLHTAKLWFAGKHANWKLAAFQLEEIDELMEEVASHKIKEGGVDIGGTMDSIRQTQVRKLAAAAKNGDGKAFLEQYDELLRGCNDCHLRSGHDYIQIIRPQRPPIGNQRFDPPK